MGSSYTGADIVGMTLIVSAVVTISVVDLIRRAASHNKAVLP